MLLQKHINKGHWSRTAFKHLMTWVGLGIIIFLALFYLGEKKIAIRFVIMFILTAPVPVYLHFWIFDHYFTKGKYWKYILTSLALVAIFGLGSEWIFNLIIQDPNAQISGLFLILFAVICSTGFKFYGRILTQQHRIQETELRHLGTELALLKSQINPHFFFNTLNNIYSLSLQKSEQVPEIIMKLSSLMRFVLDSSKTSKVPLQDEIEFISNYVSLEKLRLPSNYDLKFIYAEVSENLVIAPMILTSIVENCFKHGLIDVSPEAFISIEISFYNNELILKAANLKSNDLDDTHDSKSGFGLDNLKKRLELLYPKRHELQIQDSKDIYSVTLKVRL